MTIANRSLERTGKSSSGFAKCIGPPLSSSDGRLHTVEEVFPDFHIGHALRGFRTREGLTQKRLGEMIGAKPSHISEMENGKRPIGKEMAKRLARALRTEYKVFL